MEARKNDELREALREAYGYTDEGAEPTKPAAPAAPAEPAEPTHDEPSDDETLGESAVDGDE
jgi:hypothetical protein